MQHLIVLAIFPFFLTTCGTERRNERTPKSSSAAKALNAFEDSASTGSRSNGTVQAPAVNPELFLIQPVVSDVAVSSSNYVCPARARLSGLQAKLARCVYETSIAIEGLSPTSLIFDSRQFEKGGRLNIDLELVKSDQQADTYVLEVPGAQSTVFTKVSDTEYQSGDPLGTLRSTLSESQATIRSTRENYDFRMTFTKDNAGRFRLTERQIARQQLAIERTASGQISSARWLARGQEERRLDFTYTRNQLVSVRARDASQSLKYDRLGRLVQSTLQRGSASASTHLAYAGEESFVIGAVVSSGGQVAALQYDAWKDDKGKTHLSVKRKANENNHSEVYSYSPNRMQVKTPTAIRELSFSNDLVTQVLENGRHAQSYAYDPKLRVVSTTDRFMRETRYEYFDDKSLVKKISHLSTGTTIEYEYDAKERLVKTTESANGRSIVTNIELDEMGRPIQRKVNGVAVSPTYQYDANGNLASMSVNSQPVYSASYDESGRLVEASNITGSRIAIERPSPDTILVTDDFGAVQKFESGTTGAQQWSRLTANSGLVVDSRIGENKAVRTISNGEQSLSTATEVVTDGTRRIVSKSVSVNDRLIESDTNETRFGKFYMSSKVSATSLFPEIFGLAPKSSGPALALTSGGASTTSNVTTANAQGCCPRDNVQAGLNNSYNSPTVIVNPVAPGGG